MIEVPAHDAPSRDGSSDQLPNPCCFAPGGCARIVGHTSPSWYAAGDTITVCAPVSKGARLPRAEQRRLVYARQLRREPDERAEAVVDHRAAPSRSGRT